MKARYLCLLLLLLPFSFAHEEDTFALGEQLIKDKIPCQNLSEAQLEIIGEYYMEQMYPGELHEIMDERMGGDGSEQLRQVHIVMARNFYCGEHQTMMPMMMDGLMGRARFGGMMDNLITPQEFMMGSFRGFLITMLGIGLLLLVILLIIKLLKELKK